MKELGKQDKYNKERIPNMGKDGAIRTKDEKQETKAENCTEQNRKTGIA